MASATSVAGSQLASASENNQNGDAPTQAERIQAKFDLGIALALASWPALTLAVQSQWGGPDSADKRDWFGGAISDLFVTRPETDLEDVETVLLQVMVDEFEVTVDDDSAFEVAQTIMALRKSTLEGDYELVNEMQKVWSDKKGKSGVKFQKVDRPEEDDETDWDSDDLEDEDEDDVDMADAPPPAPREKPLPEIDEDGFTKVVSKKKR